MALNRKSGGTDGPKVEYTNLEEREYDMRLVFVADLGMQDGMIWKGEQKPDSQQIALGFEVLGEFVAIDEEEFPRIIWSKPFNIFRTLTSKGNEMKWYSVFDKSADDGDIPDWDSQLGKPVIGTIEHTEGSEGQVFDNLKGIAPVPAKYADDIAKNITAPCIGDSDDPENRATKALSGLARWVYNKRQGAPQAETADDPF